jgi:hypothetical protein
LLEAVKHAWIGDRDAGPDEFGAPDAAGATSRCDGQYVVALGTCGLLDDFESDSTGHAPGALLAADGRKGSWAPVDTETDPGTHVNASALVDSIDVSNGDLPGSRHALHFTVTGATDWGADVSALFGGCYDISGTSYSGIRFWARALSPVTVLTGVHTADTHGNYDCTAASGCWGFYRKAIDLDSSWRKFEIAWSDLHQPSWAIAVAFNPKKLLSLVFSTEDAKPVDVWIDDPGFLGVSDSGCPGATDAGADVDDADLAPPDGPPFDGAAAGAGE